jgi:integrase
MRRGEILGLRWAYVDLEQQTVFLPITKSGKSRFVTLSMRAVETLRKMDRSPDGRVFPIEMAAMEANFLRAVRRANLGNLHFHDLRHTGTSRMAAKLPNVIELAAVTGHTSLQMLKRYYHPQAHELAKKLG